MPIATEYIFILLFSIVILIVFVYFLFKLNANRLIKRNNELNEKLSNALGELTATRRVLENIIENSGQVIFTCDPDGKIVTWSNAAKEMFGMESEKVLLNDLSILNTINDSRKFEDIFKQVLDSHHKIEEPLKKVLKNGQIKDLFVMANPITMEGNQIDSISFIMRDVSEVNKLSELRANSDRMLEGYSSMSAMHSSLLHYLANCVSGISSIGQLVQMENKYMEKFHETAMIQAEKIHNVLSGLSKLNEKIKDRLSETKDLQNKQFSIEKEINEFRNSYEIKKVPTSG